MKKAFTMIELVFAIAIIGVLAAVVAPKLMGTRTDAEIAKLKEQVRAINTSIQAYSKQKMLITGNMNEDDSFPSSLNDNGVLFGKVLSGADTSKWVQDTYGGVPQDHLYRFYIGKPNNKNLNTLWCAYAINQSTINGIKGYNNAIDWHIGDFKCYQFKDSKGNIDNTFIDKIFN